MPSEFTWNDELVKEFHNYAMGNFSACHPLSDRVEKFKQSKIKEKERITVKISQEFGSTMKHHVSGDGFYHPYRLEVYGEELTERQRDKLKMACEYILNEENPKVYSSQPISTELWEHTDIAEPTPLSGTMVTLEECEKQKREAFISGRLMRPLPFEHHVYPTYEDYQQSLK